MTKKWPHFRVALFFLEFHFLLSDFLISFENDFAYILSAFIFNNAIYFKSSSINYCLYFFIFDWLFKNQRNAFIKESWRIRMILILSFHCSSSRVIILKIYFIKWCEFLYIAIKFERAF